MREGAARLLQQNRPSFHLWVLDERSRAQVPSVARGEPGRDLYARPIPGGGHALEHRIAWADASAFAAVRLSEEP